MKQIRSSRSSQKSMGKGISLTPAAKRELSELVSTEHFQIEG